MCKRTEEILKELGVENKIQKYKYNRFNPISRMEDIRITKLIISYKSRRHKILLDVTERGPMYPISMKIINLFCIEVFTDVNRDVFVSV